MKRSLEKISCRTPETRRPTRLSAKKEKVVLSDELFLDLMRADVTAIAAQVDSDVKVLGRIKTKSSIEEKALRQRVDAEEIHDKVGIRVVVATTEQCFILLERLHAARDSLREHFDDYVSRPKANGYRALHTILLGPSGRSLEVQVRSRDMHSCAESGSACHGAYKSSRVEPPHLPQAPAFDILRLVPAEGSS